MSNSKTCPDCGCTLNGGICSNCQEELYIITYQSDDVVEPLSDKFVADAKEQEQLLKHRKAGIE